MAWLMMSVGRPQHMSDIYIAYRIKDKLMRINAYTKRGNTALRETNYAMKSLPQCSSGQDHWHFIPDENERLKGSSIVA